NSLLFCRATSDPSENLPLRTTDTIDGQTLHRELVGFRNSINDIFEVSIDRYHLLYSKLCRILIANASRENASNCL
ncbi:MAG: hypothetical protein MHMPM18_004957, partial [Marteilia pararefringens]